MSAWRTQVFFRDREFWWALTNNYWSHSAMMDVLLGGGIIGAALLLVAIVWSGARQLGSESLRRGATQRFAVVSSGTRWPGRSGNSLASCSGLPRPLRRVLRPALGGSLRLLVIEGPSKAGLQPVQHKGQPD